MFYRIREHHFTPADLNNITLDDPGGQRTSDVRYMSWVWRVKNRSQSANEFTHDTFHCHNTDYLGSSNFLHRLLLSSNEECKADSNNIHEKERKRCSDSWPSAPD
jgi:hypothetical protein